MKSGLTTLAKFVAGSALGATIGASIGLLLAPKSGEQLQSETATYIDHVKTEGDRARAEAEERIREEFRQQVNDPTAFTSKA